MAELKTTIIDTTKCHKCGCVVMPDAIKCPRCGAAYSNHRTAQLDDIIKYHQLEMKGAKHTTQIVTARYQLICPYHGKINIRATVTSPSVKCPFC